MSTKEDAKKTGKGWKRLVITITVLLIGTLFTGLGIMLSATFIYPMNMDRFWLGIGLLGGAGGAFPLILVPLLMIWLFRKRTNIFSTVQSFKLSKIGPYAPGYKPSGVKKPRFCEYCGYEVVAGERECPECGGPTKSIKSTYIT